MSNAIAVRNDETLGEVRSAPTEINFGDLLALSQELVKTGFLPTHIKNAGQAAAIILTGRELGMGPMRALRSLQVIQGKVVESADSQLARFKSDGGRAAFSQLDEHGAVLVLRHPNGDEHTERFGPEDAKRAGLAGDSYRKYPVPMYRSRAITAGLKSVGWEGGAGAYDPAEAAEFLPNVVVPPEDTGEAATKAQRDKLAQLMESHVWSEDERVKAARKIGKATVVQASAMIAGASAVLAQREAAEADAEGDAREPEEVGA